MISRSKLKDLHILKTNITDRIATIVEEYITDLDGEPGIFITDHAIGRYKERVGLNEQMDYQQIRKEMLSIEEDRVILRKQLNFFIPNGKKYGYIIKNLSLITVVKLG